MTRQTAGEGGSARPIKPPGCRLAPRWALLLALLASTVAPAMAGGPYAITKSGQPYRWSASAGMRYAVDAGAFGSRAHAWVVAQIDKSFHAWQSAPGASLRIEAARELTQNITGRNVEDFLDALSEGDPSPILLDSDGTIFDDLFGTGAGDAIFGIGLPYTVDEAKGVIQVSVAILNGKLLTGYNDGFAAGNTVHELGHTLNMAHSQVNADLLYDGDPDDDSACPAMFYRGPNDKGGLQADDLAWFAWLYPAGDSAGLGSVRGRVLLPDGATGFQGVQVIARRIDDPRVTAVGAVSGFLFNNGDGGVSDPNRLGEFVIPNLPPGSYTLELKQLSSFPGVPVPQGYLFSGGKFWHEGSSAQDAPGASTSVVVNAGQEVGGIDIVVNGGTLGEPKPFTEQEPNELPGGQPVTLPAAITGSLQDRVDSGAPGSVGDTHDVYRLTLREDTIVTAVLTAEQSKADLDLDLLYLDHQSYFVVAESTEGSGSAESLQLLLPAGRYYIGVHRAGERGSAYTLRLMATPAPEEESKADAIWINYLVVGDVTQTGATLRWQATGDTTAVAYYNSPVREIGSTVRAREHTLAMSDIAARTKSFVEVHAAADGGDDLTYAPFRTATAPDPEGVPRITVGKDSYPVDYDLWEVEVRLSNPGDGDAQNVRVEQVAPAAGWAVLSSIYTGTQLPDKLEVGGIGAGGAGALIIRLIRLRGAEDPDVTVHGTYTDPGTGRVRKF